MAEVIGVVAAGAIIGLVLIGVANYVAWRWVYLVPADNRELKWIADECAKCPAAKEYIRRVLTERDYLMTCDWHETYRLYKEMMQDERNAERQSRMERIREAVK